MTDKQIDQLVQILEHYGTRAQRLKLNEELEELRDANIEDLVDDTEETAADSHAHFIKELADVTIMLEQIKLSMTPQEQAKYYCMIDYKINRTIGRIERGEGL